MRQINRESHRWGWWHWITRRQTDRQLWCYKASFWLEIQVYEIRPKQYLKTVLTAKDRNRVRQKYKTIKDKCRSVRNTTAHHCDSLTQTEKPHADFLFFSQAEWLQNNNISIHSDHVWLFFISLYKHKVALHFKQRRKGWKINKQNNYAASSASWTPLHSLPQFTTKPLRPQASCLFISSLICLSYIWRRSRCGHQRM